MLPSGLILKCRETKWWKPVTCDSTILQTNSWCFGTTRTSWAPPCAIQGLERRDGVSLPNSECKGVGGADEEVHGGDGVGWSWEGGTCRSICGEGPLTQPCTCLPNMYSQYQSINSIEILGYRNIHAQNSTISSFMSGFRQTTLLTNHGLPEWVSHRAELWVLTIVCAE